jgi:hypothetical protein
MLVPYISEDAIKDASALFGMCIVVVSDGRGHKEPIFVQMEHRYRNLQNKALPLRSPKVGVPPASDPGPGLRIPLQDPVRITRHTFIRQMLDACKAQEKWK